jgi:hypothetical protein
MTELDRFDRQLERLAELLAEEPDATRLRAERVSGWSVAEQLDHVLRIVEAQLERLAERRVAKRGINLVGRIILGVGRIPRGVGKSPAPVRGTAKSRAELRAALAAARARLATLSADAALWGDPRPLAGHPYFGGLTPRQVLRFLEVHTDHHLRIVADIRRAAGG